MIYLRMTRIMLHTINQMPWGILLILAPMIGGLLCFLWPLISRQLTLLVCSFNLLAFVLFSLQIESQGVFVHKAGGWGAPLGIELYADGLSLLMLLMTSLVSLFISSYASSYFNNDTAKRFWPLFLFLITGLNGLFLSADIFNYYVCLELIALSAVSLTAINGSIASLQGAMRYLFATLLGSLAFLLGVSLLYHAYGTVDIAQLSQHISPDIYSLTALALMVTGLLLKTALFPFHFWLPPAHSSAAAPVSALLSALVIKASFYILVRLWLSFYSSIAEHTDTILGALGCAAILWGSLQALRQTRLKLMIAYSTVAQVGYLFLVFPLTSHNTQQAWLAVSYLALSHALAKSAMFMAAGNLLMYGNHDRIEDLDRVVQRLPVTAAAFALAGVSIMSLPPSGGFIGKWLLLESAISQQQWLLVGVMLIGGLLAAAYIFKVLGHAFTTADIPHEAIHVPASMQWSALFLALAAIALGFLSPQLLDLLNIGQPFSIRGIS